MARAVVLPNAAIEEVDDRFPAIAEYLAKRAASPEANPVLRRLDVRIGQLPGPAETGRPATVTHAPRLSGSAQAQGVPKLAAITHVVEAAIGQSSNIDPRS